MFGYYSNSASYLKQSCLFKLKYGLFSCFKTKSTLKSMLFIHQIANETSVLPEKRLISFSEMIQFKRSEAKKSILVQVQSAQSYKQLFSYCNSLGNVKQMLHYTTGIDPMHFIVVEFANEDDAHNIINSSCYLDDAQIVPVKSSFLWFRATNRKATKLKQAKGIKLSLENGNRIPSDSYVKETLKNCSNVSQQMETLYNLTKLNDLGTRLRFLTARQIEMALSGIFSNVAVFPFGSSVNGCGKMGCDLDLVLNFDRRKEQKDSRLVFHCKASSALERTTSQRHLETIGDVVQLFLPGCTQVRRILQARIPIIKYYQQLSDVECDLSMSNMSGVHMSDLLYIWGSIDHRVRPLIFTIRKWAQEVGLTNSLPGRWITNFSLTLLVLAFLQKPTSSPPVLPSLNTLVKYAGPNDVFVTEDGITCTFIRDVNKLNIQTSNNDTNESLLKQFFEYYSNFDFASKAICLNEAVPITKPDHSALYIVNPLERGLNVSKNVSIDELERFKTELRNAAWILESEENKTETLGIGGLFEGKKRTVTNSFYVPNKQGRLMDISSIFNEESDAPNEKIKQKNIEYMKDVENEETNR